MTYSCPGSQKFKKPYPETMKCIYCGAEVEIWSDEVEATCSNCAKKIFRIEGQSCIDWCKCAKECVGAEIFDNHIKNRKVGV